MERTLNLNDGWEAVVNNPEKQERINRFHAKRREEKLNRFGEKVSLFAIMAGFFGLMGITGTFAAWVSAPLFTVSTAWAFFNYGRYSQLKGR